MARSIDFVGAKVYSDVCRDICGLGAGLGAWYGAQFVVCVPALTKTDVPMDLILRSRARHGVSKDGPKRHGLWPSFEMAHRNRPLPILVPKSGRPDFDAPPQDEV
jgi:hypothetical protein